MSLRFLATGLSILLTMASGSIFAAELSDDGVEVSFQKGTSGITPPTNSPALGPSKAAISSEIMHTLAQNPFHSVEAEIASLEIAEYLRQEVERQELKRKLERYAAGDMFLVELGVKMSDVYKALMMETKDATISAIQRETLPFYVGSMTAAWTLPPFMAETQRPLLEQHIEEALIDKFIRVQEDYEQKGNVAKSASEDDFFQEVDLIEGREDPHGDDE